MAVETYELIITGFVANEFVQTVLHLTGNNTVGQPAYFRAKDILDNSTADDQLIKKYLNCLPEDYKGSSMRCRRVSAGGGPTAVALASEWESQVGGRTGHISSIQANPLIIWIPTVTPNKVGKTFMPGVSEADIDEMLLSADLITAYNDFIEYFTNPISLSADTIQGSVLRKATHVGDIIDAGRISPVIGTQRRRLHPV